MKILDKVFEVVFSRFRRQPGNSNVEFAWQRATNMVCGYLALPIAATAWVSVVIVYGFTRIGTPAEHKQLGQVGGVIAGLVVFVLLKQHFRKFLSPAPPLPQQESPRDKLFVFWFRVGCFVLFALVCLIGYALNKSGLPFIQGI